MYKKNNKFSLIELLLVMAISAIMLGIVVPTFHKITKGVSVESAARQLGAQLKAVREHAITNRVYVALIMEPAGNSVLDSDHSGKAYRPCVVEKNGSNWDFDSWVEDERWEFLPAGTEIESIVNISENVDNIPSTGQLPNVIIFSPTGKCEGITSKATVTVAETVGSSGTQNKVNITIAPYTGRVSYGND